jgi:hypothetical protein
MQLREQVVKGVWSERDMQRRRVYRAEGMAWDDHPADKVEFPEIEDVAREVKRLLDSRRVWKAFPFMSPHTPKSHERASFTIEDGRGSRTARGGASGLAFPRRQRRRWVILHELAHLLHAREQKAVRASMALVDSDIFTRKGYTAAHGWRFCMIYLQLVRWFVGKAEHDALKAHFKGLRVRYRPPRVMSPEQRAAAAERLKKVRVNAQFWKQHNRIAA